MLLYIADSGLAAVKGLEMATVAQKMGRLVLSLPRGKGYLYSMLNIIEKIIAPFP